MTYLERYQPQLVLELQQLAHLVIQAGSTAQSLGSGHKK